MSNQPAFTRRQFLGTSLAMISTAAAVPIFLDDSAWAMADPDGRAPGNIPGTPDQRILVVVQLTGGNDGLNTVVPFGMPEYYNSRPRMAIEEKQVLRIAGADGVGLNPELAPLKSMLDDGMASIIQGVGYPNPNRSHFSSMDIWHTADTNGGRGLGWLGRAMDEELATHDGKIPATSCVCVGGEAPLAAAGMLYKPISFERSNLFRWVGRDLHPALGAEYDRINRAGVVGPAAEAAARPLISSANGPANQAAFVMRTALDAQLASDRIRGALAGDPLTAFPDSPLANQLKMVAKMIKAELPTRVYYVSMGSFDTHANQPNNHGRLLGQFSAAVQAFYAELKAMGQRSRVLTLAFSEFGRRVEQNASNGTDHGTAGPVFMFGDMIRPGLLGEHPSLKADRLDKGDLVFNADFRSIYADVLDGWMKINSAKVLGQAFPRAQVLKTKARV
ncbi:MAG: DUF1501 domain-containing protein [Planctomycetota bacterium]|nr:DUF1501 domain-containing protein [Planctomycetota bacterium]